MTSTCQYKFTFSLQSSILIVVMSITLLALDRVRVSQIESNWVDRIIWILFLKSLHELFTNLKKNQPHGKLLRVGLWCDFLRKFMSFPKKSRNKIMPDKRIPQLGFEPTMTYFRISTNTYFQFVSHQHFEFRFCL